MKGILFWIVPPLVGALIGYVTNYVAIKMLFRPLKEVRLFGGKFRLPFTPGILPRERRKLADSIGRMVEQELLTPGVLRERLAKTEVQEGIENAVGEYTGKVFGRPLSNWLEGRDNGFPLPEILKDFVNSDVFNSFLEELIRNWAKEKFSPSRGSWIKTQVWNFSEMFIPWVRDVIKDGLKRDIKNNAPGEPSSYRQALETIAENYPGISLGEFLALGQPKKQRLDAFLAGKAADTLDGNIENALSAVDVRTLVSDRINSLDMIRVEKIVLDVMAGQLKWINFFGAILGALIGFVQVILSLISRT